MKTLPWFRMYSDFIHDEMVEMLAFEDQRHTATSFTMKWLRCWRLKISAILCFCFA